MYVCKHISVENYFDIWNKYIIHYFFLSKYTYYALVQIALLRHVTYDTKRL